MVNIFNSFQIIEQSEQVTFKKKKKNGFHWWFDCMFDCEYTKLLFITKQTREREVNWSSNEIPAYIENMGAQTFALSSEQTGAMV